jgi:outer membrane protein OmpA-like peptidoglycan-associated protein
MRAMQNPLPVGQCTAIEVVVRDAAGGVPLRPDGRQLDWQDFELSFTTTAPDAFGWSNEKHRFLCARTPTAASALVMAHYPGSHLRPNEVLPGMNVNQQVEVFIQGVAPGPAYSQAPSPTAGPGQPYQAPANQPQPTAAAPAYQPQPAAPAPGYQSQPTAPAPGYQPQPAPPAPAGYPQAAPAQPYPQGQPAQTAAQPVSPAPAYPQSATPADPNQAQAYAPPGYQQPPAAPPQYGPPATAAPAPAPAPATPLADAKPAKGIGGLFKRIGEHAKKTAGEVTNQTTENLVSGANQIVDATAQTGSGLVSGATAQVSSAARSGVGGIGKSLLRPSGSSDNLAAALGYGEAEFRNQLFSANTAVLEPAGRDLVERLAAELKTRPGRYQIQVHVDPGENALQLSEQRAAVLKSALIKQGVEAARVESLGYGASMFKPEAPPDGGKPSSERVVITQIKTQ